MKKCPKCGAENRDIAKFCSDCREPFSEDSVNLSKRKFTLFTILVFVVMLGVIIYLVVSRQTGLEKSVLVVPQIQTIAVASLGATYTPTVVFTPTEDAKKNNNSRTAKRAQKQQHHVKVIVPEIKTIEPTPEEPNPEATVFAFAPLLTKTVSGSKELSEGQEAEQAKNYRDAMVWYEQAAALGNSDAEQRIGSIYNLGMGVTKDYQKAMYWYLKAAGHGNSDALCNIGGLYQNGDGVEQNYVEAMMWFQKAADHGNADAEFNIGWLYEHGYGTLKNYQKALDWYQKSADDGNQDALKMIEQTKNEMPQ